ncbi:hypothetical protein C8R44DRAFT_943746 [Mycena epipterygia]|nr:hypothetical protein C8R44DRAFT_943746 [Mycena epipterygia]
MRRILVTKYERAPIATSTAVRRDILIPISASQARRRTPASRTPTGTSAGIDPLTSTRSDLHRCIGQKAMAFWLWYLGQSQILSQFPAKSHGSGQSQAKASQSHGFGFGLASDFRKPKPLLSGQAKARTSLAVRRVSKPFTEKEEGERRTKRGVCGGFRLGQDVDIPILGIGVQDALRGYTGIGRDVPRVATVEAMPDRPNCLSGGCLVHMRAGGMRRRGVFPVLGQALLPEWAPRFSIPDEDWAAHPRFGSNGVVAVDV